MWVWYNTGLGDLVVCEVVGVGGGILAFCGSS